MRQILMSTLLLLLGWPTAARAEWQLRPSVGLALGGATTFPDTELAAGKVHTIFSVSGALIGDVLGLEADFGRASGFFQQSPGNHTVARSNVTTLTGNITVALPRRFSEYTLRPYFVGGGGLMHLRADNFVPSLSISDDAASVDLGGGVTGFFTRRIGVNWDIRHFRTVRGNGDGSVDVVGGRLSFWRANMALAIRY